MLILVTAVLLTTILLSSYSAFAAAAHQPQKHYDSFILTASGRAHNEQGKIVNVELTIEGKTNGIIRTVFHVKTQGGDATVTGYQTISATKGYGIIINKNHFAQFYILMSAQYYGGSSTLWMLKGHTGTLRDDTLPVSLESRRVVLPIDGYPRLTHLKLRGTITFS